MIDLRNTLLQSIQVGSNIVVGARNVYCKDIEDEMVVGGAPTVLLAILMN